jgi:hypothetical protein
MAQQKKTYQKLPGSKKGFLIGKHTLWQAKDHLLHIFSRFGVEDYKRFYFNDIQAVITRKTIVGKIQNAVSGCFILICLLPTFMLDDGWAIFGGIASAMMFIFLLINLYRGPTCETTLMTAVQTEKLHSLNRLKNALKVMDRLRADVQMVQGNLNRQDLNTTPVRSTISNASPGAAQKNGLLRSPLRRESGKAHMVLFGLLLFDGLLAILEFFITHVVPTLLSSVTGLCMGIFVIIALAKQHNSDMPGSLRTVTWTSLGYIGITFVAGYVVSMVFAMKNPDLVYNQLEIFKSLANLSPWESPLKLGFNIFVICGALFLGLPGLWILHRAERRIKIPAAGKVATLHRPAVSRNFETG